MSVKIADIRKVRTITTTQEEVDLALAYLRGEKVISNKSRLTSEELLKIAEYGHIGPVVRIFEPDGRERDFHFTVYDDSYISHASTKTKTLHTVGLGYLVLLDEAGQDIEKVELSRTGGFLRAVAGNQKDRDSIDKMLLYRTTPEFSLRMQNKAYGISK